MLLLRPNCLGWHCQPFSSMMVSLLARISLSLSMLIANAGSSAAFNSTPGVDIWCGKAYRSTNASFEPGGWLEPPQSTKPLLDLRVRPRMNLYTPGDVEGSFIIDAGISYAVGQPFEYDVLQRDWNPPYALAIEISILSPEGSGPVYTGPFLASVNSTENEVPFPLLDVPPSFDPYHVTLTAVMVPGGKQIYTASTLLYKLPYRTDGGSVAKLDSLYGGILVQDYLTGSHTWEAILPYSFYVSWDGWLEKSLNNVQKFKDQGYNILHIVPNAGLPNQAFNFTELDLFLDKCDEIGLWLMYDMRWTYKNLTEVEEQVDRLKSRKSMLLWYTGDEPDGQGDPLDAPKLAYDRIKSLDPWHPVSLCLNCYNFYYEDYSSGADIILSDVYPVAIDATWSAVYDTVCNATYGCCGCDDCKGEFEDISNRLDLFAQYQGWIGGGPKTYWGVPQAFGNESFWIRYPTAAEEVTMNMLSINHNAKGIVMWDYPTSEELGDVTSALARVLASRDVTRFLLGAPTVALKVTSGQQRIDAAGWRVGNRMLVSILYLDYSALSSRVAVALPFGGARSIEKTLWGSDGWQVSQGQLVKNGMDALESNLVIVEWPSPLQD